MVNGLQDYQLGQVITAIGGSGNGGLRLGGRSQGVFQGHQPRGTEAHS